MHIHQDNKISYRRWILETLLITVLYYITGRLGQAIALPPGNVSLIWPPSGIALGIILLMGNRGLPGLWLGATLVNGLNFYTGAAEVNHLLFITIAMIIGIGSILQPLLCRYLIIRVTGTVNPFINLGNFYKYLAIIPVMCLVSATIGVISMVSGSLISMDISGQTWLTWWIGDALGVLVFLPLVFVSVSQIGSGDRGRFITLLVIMGTMTIGIASISLALMYKVYQQNQLENLETLVKTQARMFESVAIFDMKYSNEDHVDGWKAATLSQIKRAHKRWPGTGETETGEFVLAYEEEEQMHFIVGQRLNNMQIPDSIPMNGTKAEIMRRALKGQSGSLICTSSKPFELRVA